MLCLPPPLSLPHNSPPTSPHTTVYHHTSSSLSLTLSLPLLFTSTSTYPPPSLFYLSPINLSISLVFFIFLFSFYFVFCFLFAFSFCKNFPLLFLIHSSPLSLLSPPLLSSRHSPCCDKSRAEISSRPAG